MSVAPPPEVMSDEALEVPGRGPPLSVARSRVPETGFEYETV